MPASAPDASRVLPPVLTSYRLGLTVISGSLALGALVAALYHPPDPPAGQDLDPAALPLGAFRLTERSGRGVTEADLAGRVWIAAFTFTRCPSSCPRISGYMRGFQRDLARSGVRLVSVSVDPERDTPETLARYARGLGADADRWWFLTGPKADVFRLILDRFKLSVAEPSPGERKDDPSIEAVLHTTRLALVDRGNRVVGFYDSDDDAARRALLARARRLDAHSALPAVNATLNGACAVLLAVGWLLIRSGRWRAHAACMIAGVADSALFLACYLVYHFQVGSVPFRGTSQARTLYITILTSHTLLAVAMLPLIALTLGRAARGDYVRHARIARITFPIWLYVSITGVVIYLMLYRLPIPASSFPS